MSDHRFVAEPGPLDAPTLVVMLRGWIDASEAGATAMSTLAEEADVAPLVEFDDDQYIDYRARRPVMELREGINTTLRWSSVELRTGRDRAGHDLVLLSGPEPDMSWHRFTRTITELVEQLGVGQMVSMGAYPYAVPHTRPTRLSITTASESLRDRLPVAHTSLDVPAGMAVVLEHALHDLGIPAFSLWAQVPHYVSSMSYPPASVALIDGLREHAGVLIDGANVRQEALAYREHIDRLISGNREHESMVEQMEHVYDADDDPGVTPGIGAGSDTSGGRSGLGSGELPTADELAGEIERFLRDEGKNP